MEIFEKYCTFDTNVWWPQLQNGSGLVTVDERRRIYTPDPDLIERRRRADMLADGKDIGDLDALPPMEVRAYLDGRCIAIVRNNPGGPVIETFPEKISDEVAASEIIGLMRQGFGIG